MIFPIKNSLLEFFIDVSGTPPARTYFSLVSFNMITKDDIIDDFFERYPQYENKKGYQLNSYDLITTVKFFDEKKVRMFIFKRAIVDWIYYNTKYKTFEEYKEKIFGIMIMNLIKELIREDYRYNVTSCVESQWGNVHRAFHHCKRIINANNLDIQLICNHSYDHSNPGVKIADFIASSGKFFKPFNLQRENIRRYHIIRKRPPYDYFRIVFS